MPKGPPAPLLTGLAANRPPVDGRVEKAEPKARLLPLESAIGWVLSRGEHVIALPGTRSLDKLAENIARADWRPEADLVARIDALFAPGAVAGERYPPQLQVTIETEEFA